VETETQATQTNPVSSKTQVEKANVGIQVDVEKAEKVHRQRLELTGWGQ